MMLPRNLWWRKARVPMIMGTCPIMPQNAHSLKALNGTDSTTSCSAADTMKMQSMAAVRLMPSALTGCCTCTTKKL